MLIALFSAALACDPVERLEAAREALVTLNRKGAAELLAEAEEQLGCGAVDREDVQSFFVLRGISEALAKDEAAAREHFAAARGLGAEMPDFDPFGGAVAALWVESRPADGQAVISVAPEPSKRWLVRIDGEKAPDFPTEVRPGLHVVQILDRARGVPHFARVLVATPGEITAVQHGLPEVPPDPTGSSAGGGLQWALTGAVGAEVASGEAAEFQVDGERITQPGARVMVPIELGVYGSNGVIWGRAVARAGPVVGGRLIYGRDGVPRGSGAVWGGEIGGGVRLWRVEPGVVVGALLPSRARFRLVVPIAVLDAVHIEPTLGVHVLTLGGAEPFGGLAVRGRLGL